MTKIEIDLSVQTGKIKPMHATNNGPQPSGKHDVRGQAHTENPFTEACIPFIRNHDAAFCPAYGAEHVVDVENIFPNFDADENDPASYDFLLTDYYTQSLNDCGAKVFYRLGSKIEHEPKKYHTNVPKDFAKYARICEHIIRHLCYGWADGLYLDIPYWEVWNEPDCENANGENPCWQGTPEQFLEFYGVVAKHLKTCFPELKIGGPAFTDGHPEQKVAFAEYCRDNALPLDFFSFHRYTADAKEPAQDAVAMRELMDRYGFQKTELILNEWNYIRGWLGADWRYSLLTEHNEKGAAFCAAAMLACQKSPLDMLMYYDARVSTGMNGLFHPISGDKQKPYYAFWQFGQLYKLGNEVLSEADGENVYVGAARKGDNAAAQIVYYAEEDLSEEKVEIVLKGMKGKTTVLTTLVDGTHMNEPLRRDVFTCEEGSIFLTLQLHSILMLQMTCE